MSSGFQIVGRSKHVLRLRKQVEELSAKRTDACILGEVGSGKTSIAQLISSGDVVTILNLAEQDEGQLSTSFQAVVRGTIVLEELESATYRAQNEVARFLSVRPRGIRVIVTLSEQPAELASKRKLQDELATQIGKFEQVEIEPLRYRPEDIPMLVKHFAAGLVIDINALDTLVKLPWTENIRQLKSVVERCIASAQDGKFMLPEELVDERTEVVKMVGGLMQGQKARLDSSLDLIENTIIRRTLERFGFNESKAASFLGMTEHAFGQKVKRLALAKNR
jgi:DNA-binding NtrC family response regulator